MGQTSGSTSVHGLQKWAGDQARPSPLATCRVYLNGFGQELESEIVFTYFYLILRLEHGKVLLGLSNHDARGVVDAESQVLPAPHGRDDVKKLVSAHNPSGSVSQYSQISFNREQARSMSSLVAQTLRRICLSNFSPPNATPGA